MAITSKSFEPICRSSAESDGISLRQGAHQVAHRLTSTTRPRQSFRDLAAPDAVVNLRSGAGRRSGLTMNAVSEPVASCLVTFPAGAVSVGVAGASSLRPRSDIK